VLVLNGDVPLVPPEALPGLVAEAAKGRLGILTADTPDAGSYGRIVRGADGNVAQIVEAKDATAAQLTLTEWYTGTLAAPADALKRWLGMLKPNNAQNEYYLTDVVQLARAESVAVVAVKASEAWRVEGVNDRAQLAALERRYQASLADTLMKTGVALTDPERIDIRGTLACAADVSIDIGCVFEGAVTLGENVSIGPYCVIRNAHVGADTRIEAYSHIDGATINHGARIGPYARLRRGTELAADVHIGNFVEIKASRIGKGSKANHLSYIGDAEIGSDCNIGAGTITCNYDGASKHKTTIGDNVHIGSDVQLVAPVTLAAGVTVGAGTTIWKNVATGNLVINPKQQVSNSDWRRPQKKPKA
jgi:bifunctional UDP-N-acetylglucosamine pyrophosphorylase/glucosamine-1-phosphate N-acetyltransferase